MDGVNWRVKVGRREVFISCPGIFMPRCIANLSAEFVGHMLRCKALATGKMRGLPAKYRDLHPDIPPCSYPSS
jgi:hypothetical protein